MNNMFMIDGNIVLKLSHTEEITLCPDGFLSHIIGNVLIEVEPEESEKYLNNLYQVCNL